MKGDSRLQFEAAAVSLQARDLLIEVKRDEQKVTLFPRIEAVLVNARDRPRSARKNRVTRTPRVGQHAETPWSSSQKESGPKPRQARTAQFNSQGKQQEPPT